MVSRSITRLFNIVGLRLVLYFNLTYIFQFLFSSFNFCRSGLPKLKIKTDVLKKNSWVYPPKVFMGPLGYFHPWVDKKPPGTNTFLSIILCGYLLQLRAPSTSKRIGHSVPQSNLFCSTSSFSFLIHNFNIKIRLNLLAISISLHNIN